MVNGDNGYARLYRQGVARLREAGADAPEFACKCLLEHVFCDPYTKLLCSETPPPPAAAARFSALVAKHASGYPLQYIVGEWEFLSFPIHVTEGVLIPRPDTETVALAAVSFLKRRGPGSRFLELGSGSGCISVALAKMTGCSGVAVDISETAARLTRENAARNGVEAKLRVRCADLFSFYRTLPDCGFDLVVSNPPYLSARELAEADPSIRFEPREALDGGPDGLVFYRFIASAYAPKLRSGGGVCFEIGYGQAAGVTDILRKNGYMDIRVEKDYGGNDRMVMGIRAPGTAAPYKYKGE